MADQQTDTATGQTTFRSPPVTILSQYLKDLSFESPGAPASVGTVTELRQGSVTVDVRATPIGGRNYEVVLKVRVEASHEDKPLYLLEMEYGGVIQLGEVPQETIEPLLTVEAPRLLFPYARAIATDMTREGGFAPLLINPIDFAALYRDIKRKQQADHGQSTSQGEATAPGTSAVSSTTGDS